MINIKTPGKVIIDHIMWQPLYDCKVGCRGCYVADSPSAHYKGKLNNQIVKLIYLEQKVTCDQFTISLDTTPDQSEELVTALKALWEVYEVAKDCGCENYTRRSLKDQQLPELCVTAFNVTTVEKWAKAMDRSFEQFIDPLTVLSLSNLPVQGKKAHPLHETCQAKKTILNYNRMATEKSWQSKAFEVGVRYSDQTYLVLEKPTLGDEQPIENIRNLYKAYYSVDPKEKDKIQLDACIKDAVKHLNTGKTCGAGISKVHVWPDGSVTGCPYDAKHKLKEGFCTCDEGFDVFEELEKAVHGRTCHSMDHCKIPQAFKQLSNELKK